MGLGQGERASHAIGQGELAALEIAAADFSFETENHRAGGWLRQGCSVAMNRTAHGAKKFDRVKVAPKPIICGVPGGELGGGDVVDIVFDVE